MARTGIKLRTEERDKLRSALQAIDAELRWFRDAGGAVSRDDLVGMIRDTLKHIDAVRDLVYP